MAPRDARPRLGGRQGSEDSIDSDAARKKLLAEALTR